MSKTEPETQALPATIPAEELRAGVPIYNVTVGKETREVQANNKREAVRRFGSNDPNAKTELVKGDVERVPGLLPSGKSDNIPLKRLYRVTWGDEVREVTAVHADDAWSQFVGGQENSLAYKLPNTYERIVEDLGPADDTNEKAKADKGEAADKPKASPVADLNVADAKDSISRMHSQEKLQQIADNDTRASVQDAARTRLTEIGGK